MRRPYAARCPHPAEVGGLPGLRVLSRQTITAFLGGALLDRATDILRHLLHRSADRGGKTTKAVRTVCALGSYPGKRSLPVVEVFLEPEGLAT